MPIYDATPSNIAMAARALRAGELVAFATETVYGLGADATNAEAVAKIFAAKQRPRFNPLIVHIADAGSARDFAQFSPLAETLANAFWPGPLTLVLPLTPTAKIPDLTVAGLSTVAVRVPSHPIAQRLIAAAGCPVAAPSANISGHVSATTAAHVAEDFGATVGVVLDAGPCAHGLESTIIDATGTDPVILRHGAVTGGQITKATGRRLLQKTDATARPSAPGQLASHYAPGCPVRLNVRSVKDGEALLAFGPQPLPHTGVTENLSAAGDVKEAAINLFAALRRLDRIATTGIAVMAIPDQGIGSAINDRLRRAAAPR